MKLYDFLAKPLCATDSMESPGEAIKTYVYRIGRYSLYLILAGSLFYACCYLNQIPISFSLYFYFSYIFLCSIYLGTAGATITTLLDLYTQCFSSPVYGTQSKKEDCFPEDDKNQICHWLTEGKECLVLLREQIALFADHDLHQAYSSLDEMFQQIFQYLTQYPEDFSKAGLTTIVAVYQPKLQSFLDWYRTLQKASTDPKQLQREKKQLILVISKMRKLLQQNYSMLLHTRCADFDAELKAMQLTLDGELFSDTLTDDQRREVPNDPGETRLAEEDFRAELQGRYPCQR